MARGHYRILLGMAAGVGKTYRMLLEGRQAQEAGRDVVIGYLEPHDRPETTALADGPQAVPPPRAATPAPRGPRSPTASRPCRGCARSTGRWSSRRWTSRP